MRFMDRAEALVEALVERSTDAFVLALAAICYIGIGLVLPAAIGASTLAFIFWNVTGTALAAGLVFALLGKHIEAMRRRNLVEWTTNLRHLDAQEFEYFVGEVYRREGWTVRETGKQGAPDGNVDLEVTRDRQRQIVQCKCWARKAVGVDEIRSFGGTLMREGLSGKQGVFVTLSDFTVQARHEAESLGVTLVVGRDLFARAEKVRRVEACPECGEPMRFDRSSQGWWFRCTASGCVGKRDLGREPAQALGLLTTEP
jgi:hypothetical protein